MIQVTRSYHSFRWQNIRFLYDIKSEKIIPIGHDEEGGAGVYGLLADYGDNVKDDIQSNLFFKDEAVMKSFETEVTRMCADGYIDSFLTKIDRELQNNLNLIYINDYKYVAEEYVYAYNIKFIKDHLPFSK
ncbi:MAG: hypothetical protein HRT71_15815 [Flavobacteriales bacterium]|nr:hypothetical protein [Flavobacteriales bacterium]